MRYFATTLLLSILTVTSVAACTNASVRLLQNRADRGEVEAMAYLGEKLISAECSAAFQTEGIEHLSRAAQAGHAGANFRLGSLMFLAGETEKERKEAVPMIAFAAENGVVEAQEFLALHLLKEADTADQRDQAMYWFGSAADQGSTQAAMLAHTIYKHGMHGIRQDNCIAALWAEAAFLLAHPDDVAAHDFLSEC